MEKLQGGGQQDKTGREKTGVPGTVTVASWVKHHGELLLTGDCQLPEGRAWPSLPLQRKRAGVPSSAPLVVAVHAYHLPVPVGEEVLDVHFQVWHYPRIDS